MTKEAILNFVREIQDNEAILDFVSAVIDAAETLAKATQAEERERCAKLAECHAYSGGDYERRGAGHRR